MTASACKPDRIRRARLLWAATDEADLRYLAGVPHAEGLVVAQVGRTLHLLAPDMEIGRLRRRLGPRAELHPLSAFRRRGRGDRWQTVASFVKELQVGEVIVSDNFPVALARALSRRGIAVVTAGRSLFPQRRSKSPQEVRMIRRAEQIAADAMRLCYRVLRESSVGSDGRLQWEGRTLTSERLRRVIEDFICRRGAVAQNTIVSCGKRSADPHEIGHGPLYAQQPIVIDIFPRDRATGYWGDLTRTVVKGRMSARLRRMYRAVLAAQREAVSRLRAGVSVRRVHAAARRVLEQAGFHTELGEQPCGFIHGLGHGVGLEIHEPPVLADCRGTLRRGDVVTIEPGLYYPEVGGVRLEDLFLVTSDGARRISRCRLVAEIA